MKKIILLFLIIFFIKNCAYSWDTIHVRALSDFTSVNPSNTFQTQVIEEGKVFETTLFKDDILNLKLKEIKAPTRGKNDAKIYFNVLNYQNNFEPHEFFEPLVAKYSKTAINKEEIKKMPKKGLIKKGAGAIGDYFFKGVSYGISFADGVATNEEGNRLKSGVKQLYDDSFLSLIEYGKDIEIKKGDEFYFIIKKEKDSDKD